MKEAIRIINNQVKNSKKIDNNKKLENLYKCQ